MLMKRQKTLPLVDRAWRYDDSISGFFSSEIPLGKRKVTISTPLVHPVKIRKPRNQSITRLNQCPGQESNLHALRHTHLKRARLPIPPPGLLEIVVCKSNTFFSFTNYFYEKNLLAQEFVLKQKQIDDGDGDIGVGQVEDGPEKVVVAVHQEV